MAKHRYTDEEIAEWRLTHSSFGYFNRDDSNFFIPKAYGIGRTFNWAHPASWLVGAIIIAVVIYTLFITPHHPRLL